MRGVETEVRDRGLETGAYRLAGLGRTRHPAGSWSSTTQAPGDPPPGPRGEEGTLGNRARTRKGA